VREAAPVVADRAPARSPAALRWLLPKVRPALDRARLVRPRVWGVAGGILVSLVAATTVLPANDSDPVADDASGPTELTGASQDASAPEAEPFPPDTSSLPTAPPATPPMISGPGRGTSPDGSAAAPDPRVGDDPIAALDALLRDRERCIRDLSLLCLDGVLQAGSVAMQHDADLVRAVQAGGELTEDASIVAQAPVLLERLGDSAIVELGDVAQTQPASVLMMRSEAGWRIRNYLYR
jgi:hypothetical protein